MNIYKGIFAEYFPNLHNNHNNMAIFKMHDHLLSILAIGLRPS